MPRIDKDAGAWVLYRGAVECGNTSRVMFYPNYAIILF